MTKMVAAVSCVDSGQMAEEALYYLRQNSDPEVTKIILIDNGSYDPLQKYDADAVVRFDPNIGGNAVFHRMLSVLEHEYQTDLVAYFHCDLMIREKGWDHRVIDYFQKDPLLGLAGFIGSSEIGADGGRGSGTISSFIGAEYRTGWASPAKIHGAVAVDTHPAAVLDHASMIFPLDILKQLPKQEDMHTPGHFYDRVLSCEVLSRGYHIAVLGIQCDHFSGGTGMGKVPGEQKGPRNRDEMYIRWLTANNMTWNKDNPDLTIYVEGEKRFLSKWRDELHFIPLRVNSDHSINHLAR